MNHYVYIITNLINGRKYIGKRSCNCAIEDDKYMGSGSALRNAKKKYGKENFEKKILLVCNSEKEAYDEEKKAIELVKAWGNPMYYNISGGGEGFGSGEGHIFYGKSRSDETKKKLSEAHTGKKLSEETKRKISESKKGVRLSKETKKKLGLLRMGKNNHKAKCVVNLNTNKIFDTLTEAAKWCDLKSSTSIIRCCKGEQKSSGQHPITGEPLVWMYLTDYEKMSEEEIEMAIEYANKTQCGKTHHGAKSVICLNTHEIFDTIKDASVWYGIGHGNIVKTCQGERKCAGKHPVTGKKLQWMYLEDYENKYGKMNQKIS